MTRSARAWLWTGIGLVVAGLFVTRLLPCVDYPQHLALADVERRLLAPNSPDHGAYDLNLFTYNGLFHLLVAVLSGLVPIELAGRCVVAGSLVATAAAVVALVRTLRRPAHYAALFTPALFSFSAGWGFVNYVLATAIAAWALVFVIRAALHPRLGNLVAVGALGLACAAAHVLAMLALCALGTASALEMGWRTAPSSPSARRRAGRALLRAAVATTPLALGCVYCVAVYLRQYDWDPNMYRDPVLEGSAPALWKKALLFAAYTTSSFRDLTDQVFLWIAIAFMAFATFAAVLATRRGGRSGDDVPPTLPSASPEAEALRPAPPGGILLLAPLVVAVVGYLVTPMVLVGTHLIFPRLGQWVVLGAVIAVPALPAAMADRWRPWVLALGVAAGFNVFAHCAVFEWESGDASALIDDLPPGRAVTAVILDPKMLSFRNGVLTHLAAYYGARKHGPWAFSFARYLSVPVRFRADSQVPWPERGWERDGGGGAYDPRCNYARAFPVVIVQAPPDVADEVAVRKLVFGQDATAVRLLSHRGRFWAFDSEGLPADGVR